MGRVIPFPPCQFFEVHGSKFKLHQFCHLGQASVLCITHRMFFFCICKVSFNRFFAVLVKLLVSVRFHTYRGLLHNRRIEPFPAMLKRLLFRVSAWNSGCLSWFMMTLRGRFFLFSLFRWDVVDSRCIVTGNDGLFFQWIAQWKQCKRHHMLRKAQNCSRSIYAFLKRSQCKPCSPQT